MKNKKLHLWLFLLIEAGTVSMANAQTKVGLKAGVNFSNVVMNDKNGSKESTQSIPGIS